MIEHKYGVQGFTDAQAAMAHARSHITAKDVVILENTWFKHSPAPFAWVWPPEYADELIRNNSGIRKVSGLQA